MSHPCGTCTAPIPDTTPLGRLLHDLDTILNNTQEPRQ